MGTKGAAIKRRAEMERSGYPRTPDLPKNYLTILSIPSDYSAPKTIIVLAEE